MKPNNFVFSSRNLKLWKSSPFILSSFRFFFSKPSPFVEVFHRTSPFFFRNSSSIVPTPCWSCHRRLEDPTIFCKFCRMIQPPLEQDYFSLLQVPQSFEINLQKISQNFKSLQKKVHPDIYTMKSKEEKIFSAKQSSKLNDAYQTIKNPYTRAKYLLFLNGISIEERTMNDPEFLNKVLELREEVEEADKQRLDQISKENEERIQHSLEWISNAFKNKNLNLVQDEMDKLQYWVKLKESIENRI